MVLNFVEVNLISFVRNMGSMKIKLLGTHLSKMCMLSNVGLPKLFWGEVAHTTCYLINRSQSIALGFKTPREL
ncbi:hypothetical protein CR513_56059, partial [Mucuna pruriens]